VHRTKSSSSPDGRCDDQDAGTRTCCSKLTCGIRWPELSARIGSHPPPRGMPVQRKVCANPLKVEARAKQAPGPMLCATSAHRRGRVGGDPDIRKGWSGHS
jgi:hypothetical protein